MALAPLLLPIISLFRSAGITQARQAMFGLNKDFTHFAQSVGKAAGAFAAFQVLAGGREFAIAAVDNSQRFERNLLALQQVFEEVTPQLRAFAREAENYGLSQGQAAQASVFLGSVLKQYGLTIQESADQTQRLVTLAQDLATTYGYDVQEALLAITALFRGEYDPIEKFGVAMKQAEVNARLAADGLGDLEGEELALATAQTRLTMLFERANDSIGAYTRATDTLYGAQQQLNAVMGNLQIAFGAGLQEPIAQIINSFADLTQKHTPQLVEISVALGQAIEALAPMVAILGETFFLVLAPLETVVRFATFLFEVLGPILTPALELLNEGLLFFALVLDAAKVAGEELGKLLGGSAFGNSGLIEAFNELADVIWVLDPIGSIADGFGLLNDKLKSFIYDVSDAAEAQRDASAETERFNLSAMRSSDILDQLNSRAQEIQSPLSAFQQQLEAININVTDAEGALIGLAKVFEDLEIAAQQSEAKQSLEELGFSAGQIEEILTRPDWALIFGQISTLAKTAAMDIASVTSLAGAAAISNARTALATLIQDAFGGTRVTKTGGTARNFVADFFANIDDEVQKQVARRKLAGMGASEGLIESILGTAGWEKVFDAIISGGTRQLRRLQEQFNKTSAGIDEINRLQEDAIALAEEQEEAAREAAEALQRQQDEYAALIEKLDEFKASIKGLTLEATLATFETEVGRFERSIVSSFDNIQSKLASALDNGSIFEGAYNQLVAFANQEQKALQQIARQRDELAAKGDWVENLLRDYRNAFTAALNLTGVLNQIEDKTREITITEVTRGSARVGDAVKDLSFTLTRTYNQTITETVDKTQALVDNFRNVAERARAFAGNLETLRRLGLDPMLFNQLVQAGVEAGGETAQALVDGGSETISEINQLFKEIGDTGIAVGESVAEDFYLVGENFASELLDGIRSQQTAFEETARQLAETFEENFQVKVGKATGQVAQVAQLENQIGPLQQEQQRIMDRLAEQEAILTGGKAGPGARAWAVKKTESYNKQLDDVTAELARISGDIASIRVAPLASGGIALGSALAMIGEGGPEAVIPLDRLNEMMQGNRKGGNIYNVYVTADTRTGGSKAGEAIIQQLKQFEDRNGPIGTVLTVS